MAQRRRGQDPFPPRDEQKTPGAVRLMGVVRAVIGTVIFLDMLPVLFHGGWMILPFLLVCVIFAVSGLRTALRGTSFARRVGRPKERARERTAGQSPLEGPIKRESRRPAPRTPETHDHIPSTALDTKARLEQLETLKGAGLLTEQEYRAKRAQVLSGR